jgi:hypothetical protein
MSVHFQLTAHTGLSSLLLSRTPFSNNHKRPLCRSMCCTLMAVRPKEGTRLVGIPTGKADAVKRK